MIGSDLLVTAENSIMTRMQRGVTRAVINTNRMATVAFIKNPDLQTPWVAMEEGVRDAIGADAARFLDATRLATALLGDSLATNIFLLGYAYQMGLVPVSREALFRAIELNGAAVDANRRAFEWGRLACHDPASVERQARPAETDVGSDRVHRRSTSTPPSRAASTSSPPTRTPRWRSATGRWSIAYARPEARAAGGTRPDRRRRPQLLQAARDQGRVRSRAPVHRRRVRAPGRGARSRATTSCAITSRRRCG